MFRLNIPNDAPLVGWARENREGIACVEHGGTQGDLHFAIVQPGQAMLKVVHRSLALGTWERHIRDYTVGTDEALEAARRGTSPPLGFPGGPTSLTIPQGISERATSPSRAGSLRNGDGSHPTAGGRIGKGPRTKLRSWAEAGEPTLQGTCCVVRSASCAPGWTRSRCRLFVTGGLYGSRV